MKFAFFVTPHTGGTFTVFTTLRAELRPHGIDLRWMGPADRKALLAEPRWASEADTGEAIEPSDGVSGEQQARIMAARLADGEYDGVFVNVLSDQASTNLVRHLPERFLRIMIVHNITPGTYAAAAAICDHVHATICVSPRIRADLISSGGFSASRTVAVENVGTVPVAKMATCKSTIGTGLATLFLGRIEDQSKGVFWLSRILGALPDDVNLTVAGDGPDRGALRRLLEPLGARARLVGVVSASNVPDLMAQHDVLIMPSRYEGFGIVLAEAMAVGCVPVASRIRGVTDVIVEDGREGLLFPVGDWRGAARRIASLRADRALLARLAGAAQEKVRQRYSGARLGKEYAELIQELVARRPVIAAPLSFDSWRLPGGLRSAARTYVPRPLKNALRVAQERTKLRFGV